MTNKPALGGKAVEGTTGKTAKRGRPPKLADERKELVSLRLSPDVLAWLRASGRGWQTRVEEMLRSKMEASDPPNS